MNKINDINIVHPWGVEPQSMEPESIILSIELWVHFASFSKSDTKIISLSEFRNKVPCKMLSLSRISAIH